MKYSVGVIGNGYVGSSIAAGFSLHADMRVYDIDPRRSTHTLEEVLENSEYIFVCVPTPMDLPTGKLDASYLHTVFNAARACRRRPEQIYIIKSTTTPGTVEKIAETYEEFDIAFSPEFLTERSAYLDFINASRIIIGARPNSADRVEKLFRTRFPHTKIIKTDVTTAQFIKYMANCFFSVKVSFMNEMKQGAEALQVDWNAAMNGFVSDGRIGNSHLDVPGHDGMSGFGGKCFPKDINAFIALYQQMGIEPNILKAAWEKNLEVRERHDWLDIPGATSGSEE